MKNLLRKVKAFIRDESGASTVEYGLLVSGIAVGVTAATSGFGAVVSQKFQQITEAVGANPAAPPGLPK
ncbi:MAG: Flp family type IVb pilin [Thermodesulfobacteriota bacterium]